MAASAEGTGSAASTSVVGRHGAGSVTEAVDEESASSFEDEDFEFTFSEPLVAFEGKNPSYHDWTLVYPFLGPLLRFREALLTEVVKSSPESWTEWPETSLYKTADTSATSEWRVIPMVYTFPSNDPSKTMWVESECARMPLATRLLKAIPTLRTALFSKLGPDTELAAHRGWAPLANHVLRVHLPLSVPAPGTCGLCVDHEVRMHKEWDILVFDDSKEHFAFNRHESRDRIVLIIDLARPDGLPEGEATGGETRELMEFIASFAAGRS